MCASILVRTVSSLALAALVASPSHAAKLRKGSVELNPSLGFSHSSASFDGNDIGSTTSFNASAFVGYFLSDLMEIGGAPLVAHTSIDDPLAGTLKLTSIGLTGGLQLNFPTEGNVVPFVRGAVGFLTHSGDLGDQTSYIIPWVQGGIRLLVGDSGSVNMGIGYRHVTISDVILDEFALDVGVSLFPIRR